MIVKSEISGTVWKVEAAIGAVVAEGDVLVILESMKMEIPVEATGPGRVTEIRAGEGTPVREGDVLVVLSEI